MGIVQRLESPIIGLKNFNNWVKSILITRFAHPALAKSSVLGPLAGPHRARIIGRGKVLDMGCGKGGDITKWAKAQVKELFCVGRCHHSILLFSFDSVLSLQISPQYLSNKPKVAGKT